MFFPATEGGDTMSFSNYGSESANEYAYSRARKLGNKAYHAALQRRANPYLPVLDELVPDHLSLGRVNLGLITIPLENIVGTGTRGRTNAFACNFMPLLDDNSEFANKWGKLHRSIVEDGLRQPIKALEYMNKFYILEGNKRVSVLKSLDSVMVEAEVTRILPRRTEDKENKIYFEFLDFYKDTKINYIYFSDEGSFARLYELIGKKPGESWNSEDRADFQAAFVRFNSAYELMGGPLTGITPGDAFLIYLEVYGYDKEIFAVSSEIRSNLNRIRNEFKAKAQDESFSLLMSSTQTQKPGLLRQIMMGNQKMRVAFVNNRSPEVSAWTYWHELGKNRIETVFGSKLETRMVSNVEPEDCQATIEKLAEEGSNIIFTTSPILLSGAMKAAVNHPDVKVLNCSLLPSYHAVRSYYLRIYEAKFIIGAIAGAISDNNRIGYVADYPVYGIPASVNAFALGARLTNPRAEVYLEWSTMKDRDPLEAMAANDVHVISNRDISAPSHQSLEFGLYEQKGEFTRNLAMPVWNWGRLYEDLLRHIQNGAWNSDATQNGAQALNYWWGMDANAIDVFYSHKLDAGTRRLADLLRQQIREGSLKPFAETILSQDGALRCTSGKALTPAEIIAMDWLADNVVGTIPTVDELRPEAHPFVELQGIHNYKLPDLSEICWTDPVNDGE